MNLLDTAIGTVFVFLLFSLVVSALNEYILSLLDQRAKFLRLGLVELLGKSKADSAEKTSLGKDGENLLSQGLLNAYSRSGGTPSPSYIPPGAFVAALLDMVLAKAADKTGQPQDPNRQPTPDDLKTGIGLLEDENLQHALLTLLRTTGGDIPKFKLAVEGWFNGAMDRVSGWYKRFAQKWMIVLGLVLAGVFNVNTIGIVRTLSNDSALAKAVADQAEFYAKNTARPRTDADLEKLRNENLAAVKAAEEKLEAEKKGTNNAVTIASLKKDLEMAEAKADTLAGYEAAVGKLHSAGIPIGWTDETKTAFGFPTRGPKKSTDWSAVFEIVAGWILTAFAASLGAPFWFDLLGRFMNVRAAGRPPGEKETASTPTKPPPANLDTTPGTSRPAN